MPSWIEQIFAAQQVAREGVVRRNINDINRYASLPDLLEYAQDRGWHVVQIGDQVIVLCNPGRLQILL